MKYTYLFFLFCLNLLCAQTSNTGILSILPNTPMSTVAELDNKANGDIINDGELYVYSHYHNDGLVTFTPGLTTGSTKMYGLFGFQNLSGSVPMDWYHADFDNTMVQPAFHLSNIVNLFGQANFTTGIIDNDNHGGLLVFEDNATHTNVSDNSHVDGYVEKKGDDGFQFPIGDKGYFRHASISSPESAMASFTGKYFYENSNLLYPHFNRAGIITLIDDAEYWTVDRIASNDEIFLTLSWNETTTPAAIIAAPYEEIHIVRWDEQEQLWIDEGGVADATTKEVTTVVNPLKKYGVFTLARVKVEDILSCAGRGVVIYNAVSPDDDGINDYFTIDGIQDCPDNTVTIYNRWGKKVYETQSYNANGNTFKGFSDANYTIAPNKHLPAGTYFYIVHFKNTANATVKKAGYLYLNTNDN